MSVKALEMDLSIIIVNYKTPTLVSGCLKSIYDSVSDVEFEIIVVDNGSNDDSQKIVTSAFPQVIWIANDANEGFGRANNLGIKKSKGEYLLLLNSDIVVVENTVNQCLNEIKNRKNIGALGCLLLNEDGSFQKFTSSIASFRKMLDLNLVFNYFIKPEKFKIDAIMGAFMLIPKNVLEECGCFDPDFFFFSEEVELCHRIKKGGYSIVCLEDVNAIHKGSGSNTDRSWAFKQGFLSSALLFLKVRGWGGYLSLIHI
jgi:GT2 family glycosyltransferase